MKRLCQLEEKNGKLKEIVADLSLDKALRFVCSNVDGAKRYIARMLEAT